MNKSYKFKLQPTKEQEVLINKTFGCVRFVYNKMLVERKELYETEKIVGVKQKLSTPAKYKKEFSFLMVNRW